MTETSDIPLRILVFGAGAIGSYVGGSLALDGHAVTFLERPKNADWLRQNGLRLNLLGEERLIPEPQIAASLEKALALGPFDLAIFALKSYHTGEAIESIAPFAKDFPPVLCLQNGVENETSLSELLDEDKVIAGTVTSSIGRRDVGEVVLERLRGLGLESGHPLSPGLYAACSSSNLNPRLYPRAAEMKWSKLLTNLVANASSAILDMSPAEIFSHPGLYRLEIAQLRECLAVMRAQGLRVVDLPKTPVRALALAVRYLPLALSRPILARAVGGGRGGKMPSLHIDLHSGKGQSEVDWLNGAVVRAGERLGVPTPVNRALNETLLGLMSGETSFFAFSQKPQKLLRLVLQE